MKMRKLNIGIVAKCFLFVIFVCCITVCLVVQFNRFTKHVCNKLEGGYHWPKHVAIVMLIIKITRRLLINQHIIIPSVHQFLSNF
jgi:hypothetical protein